MNIALAFLGKIPVNLNYSASQAVIDAAVDQCGIKHVITAKRVIAKVKLTPKGTLIFGEDLAGKVGKLDKAMAFRHGEAAAGRRPRLVSAGPQGRPRLDGHGDLHLGLDRRPEGGWSSRTATSSTTSTRCARTSGSGRSRSRRSGSCRSFHSFGFTVGIWTILLLGKKAVYHSNPLDAKIVGELCEKHAITLLPCSPPSSATTSSGASPSSSGP